MSVNRKEPREGWNQPVIEGLAKVVGEERAEELAWLFTPEQLINADDKDLQIVSKGLSEYGVSHVKAYLKIVSRQSFWDILEYFLYSFAFPNDTMLRFRHLDPNLISSPAEIQQYSGLSLAQSEVVWSLMEAWKLGKIR